MKVLIVSSLLGFLLLGLLASIDLVMGVSFKGIIAKELDPFRVMEVAEYVILLLFVVLFMIQGLKAFVKRWRSKHSSS